VLDMVKEGATWFDPGVSPALMNLLLGKPGVLPEIDITVPDPEKVPTSLTKREMEVLELIVRGKSNKEIGETLEITVYTVKIHVGNLLQKMGVDDRTQAAVMALQEKLVELQPMH
jgi:DNA-binding NarL/FixJ family response regulator